MRMEYCPIAPEGLQPIAGQVSEIGERRGRIQNREPAFGLGLEALKGPNKLASREAFRLFVPKTQNHLLTSIATIPMYVKRTYPCHSPIGEPFFVSNPLCLPPDHRGSGGSPCRSLGSIGMEPGFPVSGKRACSSEPPSLMPREDRQGSGSKARFSAGAEPRAGCVASEHGEHLPFDAGS